jgi:hypothetical protein
VRERALLDLGCCQLLAAAGRAIRLRVDGAHLMARIDQGIERRHCESWRSGEHDAQPA